MTARTRHSIASLMVEMHRVKKQMEGVTDEAELFALETELRELKILAERIRYGVL